MLRCTTLCVKYSGVLQSFQKCAESVTKYRVTIDDNSLDRISRTKGVLLIVDFFST